MLEIFTTNAPDPQHWNLNSCSGAFLSARNLVQKRQTGAINANVHARCRARIFRNERSRSTPLDRELKFWCVPFRFSAFGTVSLLHKTWCKMRQTGAINAKVRATMSCKNFFTTNAPDPHHWTLNSCFGAFLSIWVHLGPFRYCTKLDAKCAKLVQLMQKFMPRCRVRIFRNEHSRSTPLDPKLMFWCVFFVWVHL